MFSVRIQKDQHGEQPCAGIAEAQRDKRGVARRCVYGAAVDQGRKKRADHHAGDQLAPAGGNRTYRLSDPQYAGSENKQRSENDEKRQIHIQESIPVSQRFGRDLIRAQKNSLIGAADRKQKPDLREQNV